MQPLKRVDFRRIMVAALMLLVFYGSLKVGSMYPNYSAALAFWCVVIQLLLVLSYYNHQS